MKSLLLVLVSTTLFNTYSFSQWVSKKIDNGFDKPHYTAYTNDDQDAYLKLESYKGVAFYISGLFICVEKVNVDILFSVNDINKRYTLTCNVSSNHETVFLVDDISSDADILADFKAASTIKIRINDTTCETEVHEFKMTGSTAAFNAVLNQK